MKKLILLSAVLCGAALMTGCFNTRLLVGNVKSTDPMVEVNKKWNDHFLFGLVPGKSTNVEVTSLTGNNANYVLHTYTSFVNGLIAVVTYGIYTPTETKVYLPVEAVRTK